MTDLGWTVSDALGQFDAAGMPVDQAGFRAVVRAARRTGNLKPLGETKSGERGGRGQILYSIADLQRLHAALVPWLEHDRGARQSKAALSPARHHARRMGGDVDSARRAVLPMRCRPRARTFPDCGC